VLIPTIVCAADFSGPVTDVLDGDTLEVLHNQHPKRISLSGIDCPEKWLNTTISQFHRLAI
jgi:endonuclease YncB( thermonuclease family)